MEYLTCLENKSIQEAWRLINKNAKGAIFIIDAENKMKGIVTDGDIRRYILKGGDLASSISYAMNTDYIFASEKESNKDILQKVNHKISIIPILDEEGILKDYFAVKDIFHPVAIPDLNGNELKYLFDAFLSTWISSSGEYIRLFESNFSKFIGTEYGIAVSNGTTAIHLALIALDIGFGDEVIIPDLTFAATINAVLHANASPVIVDINKETWCIDPDEIVRAITPNTKAIIPVHLYGQPCEMDRISNIARKNNIFIIEDCAEAHGAKFAGRKVGTFSEISCFSFFANKVITTGEGGMCLTDNPRIRDRMELLRDHGMSKVKKYWHEEIGYNYRMTNLQASLGVAQLERIDDILKERKAIEDLYREELAGFPGVSFQIEPEGSNEKITWLVSILVDNNRDAILNELSKSHIDARPFFFPLSLMEIYKKYSFSNSNSIEISRKGINIPTNITTSKGIIRKIACIIKECLNV